jgi:hypothetical protein
MKTYKYFEIVHGAPTELNISCTDPLVLRWVVSELQKVIEVHVKSYTFELSYRASLSARKGRIDTNFNNLAHEYCHLLLKDLAFQGGGGAVFLWIARLLCEAGWEPFTAGQGSQLLLRQSVELP